MADNLPRVAVTVGVFDGVHRGHQDLIRRLVSSARASSLAAACVTFDPDPASLLHPGQPCLALTTIDERRHLLHQHGIEQVRVVQFTPAVAAQSAEEFLATLAMTWTIRELWVGADFALGHDRAGTVERLGAIGHSMGFSVNAVPLLRQGGREITSTWIREALAAGDVQLAAALLGRPYAIDGPVEPGAQRGRLLGFPTANVAPPSGRALPADGVYFVEVQVLSHDEERQEAGAQPGSSNSRSHYGVVNLGARPTFDESERLIETHLLDFDGNLYGGHLNVAFLRQLRPTRKFPSFDDLRLQIERDVEAARALAAHR